MRRSLIFSLSALIVIAAASRSFAATTVPATLSGTWSGTAKAVSYSSTSTKAQRSSSTLTFVFTQTGTALSVQTTILTSDKSTLTGTLTGVYGNGNFWILGVTSNANESQSLIFTGHATSKGIKGVAIAFSGSGSDEAEVTYAVKPSSSAQIAARLEASVSTLCASTSNSASSRAAVNVAGKASGKVYTISTTGKPGPLKSTVTGSSTDSSTTQSATLTFADSTGSQTFVLNGPVIGSSFVIFGPNSSSTSQAILSLHTAKTTAKGIGILYNNGALVELKLSLKQQ